MKKTFTTIDVTAIVAELIDEVVGLRVNQIYDIDHKTYLIKLQKPDKKVVLLLESASRIHATEYEWPKSPAPSGFSMKLRKHLRNKRLESIGQLGVDRVIDLCFGSGDVAHHLIVELYDRGNIILTDGEYNILNVLRPRKDGEDTKITVHQKYPIENARVARDPPTIEMLRESLTEAKGNVPLKKILNPMLDCGGAVLDHELLEAGFTSGAKVGKDIWSYEDLERLFNAVSRAQSYVHMKTQNKDEMKGFIIKKLVERPVGDGTFENTYLYHEFHPQLYNQHIEFPFDEYQSFNKACDEYFSKLESNEVDKKVMMKEKEALRKLENVKKDHERRIQGLKGKQELDMRKGQLIELNQQLVEGALLVVRSAIANQIDWRHIQELLDEAQARKDPIARAIRALKLETNTITLWLSDPYDCDENDMLLDSDEEREEGTESEKMRPMTIDINLDLSALANARRYFNMRRQAAKKEQKTIDASSKAIKSAEKKTQQTLKEVSTIANINKARKIHWFEKYLWFISSENYLVIGGRDSQQNEQVVKRHLRPKDIYVHADLHGASSVIIKNPTGVPVPPRTLHEAGIMALCYSKAWDEKVVTSAWWVWGQQVSKTAPTGEYLTTGAFMVRGKKNFLPPSHLVYGFGFLFRLEDSSIERHEGERKVRMQEDEFSSAIEDALEKLSLDSVEVKDEEELSLEDEDEKDGLENISEEIEDENTALEQTIKDENNALKRTIKDEKDALERPFEDEKDEGIDEDDKEIVKKICHDDAEEKIYGDGVEDNSDKEEEDEIDGEQDTDKDQTNFPDTELEISYLKGDQFTLKARTAEATSVSNKAYDDGGSNSERVIFLGDDTPLIINKNQQKNKGQEGTKESTKSKKDTKNTEVKGESNVKGIPAKRGQKGKMKKMKKYKDQDEEERELRMQLLQSAGSKKPTKKEKKIMTEKRKYPRRPPPSGPREDESKKDAGDKKAKPEEADDGDDDTAQVPDDLSILNALTAVPVAEDELLYAVPVCSPYTSMTNYKYKVKLTPGPGKKGKATKTALCLFMADKSASPREKDLLRAIKDHDLAKNIPGKVKVSAPNISKIKK